MHEILVHAVHLASVTNVALQNAALIIAYRSALLTKWPIGMGLFALMIFFGPFSSLNEGISYWRIFIGLAPGALLGYLTSYFTRLAKEEDGTSKIYYFILEPAVLYFLLPLFVEETGVLVGSPVVFLICLFCLLLTHDYSIHKPVFKVYLLFYGMPCSVLLLNFIITHSLWITLGISSGIQLLLLYLYFTILT